MFISLQFNNPRIPGWMGPQGSFDPTFLGKTITCSFLQSILFLSMCTQKEMGKLNLTCFYAIFNSFIML